MTCPCGSDSTCWCCECNEYICNRQQDEIDRFKATLEHIAKGRCSNPKQCAQECLDGNIDIDHLSEDKP